MNPFQVAKNPLISGIISFMRSIILASASPRRKELLEKIGLKFKVVESKYKEYLDPKLEPHTLVKKLSLEKAKSVFENHKDSIIIAADTIVACNGKILGKPKDKKDAKRMLEFLSNTTHLIITGLTIIDANPSKIITKSIETKIYMRKMSAKEIDFYIKTKEPLDKAGAYAIQGIGSIFIKKITGDYLNAVGLPIYTLMEELRKLGISLFLI